jgi:hypothetical protein
LGEWSLLACSGDSGHSDINGREDENSIIGAVNALIYGVV